MNLLIPQEKLKEGLNIIERISGKSLTLPILNNALVRAQKSFLNLSATDLEVGVNWWSLAKIEKEGEIAVPVRLLSSFLNLLPNKQISLEEKNQSLFIQCDNHQAHIKGFLADDFPIIPQISKEEFIELEIIPFCQGLSQVVDIAALSQTRPEISGVYFSFRKDAVKVVATDSFRLGEKSFSPEKIGITVQNNKELAFILPQKTVREIINIFGDKEGKFRIYFSPNQVLFESQMTETNHPHIQLVSRLIEGEYPAYQEIIPQKHGTEIILNRSELLNQIKIASLFSGKISEVKLIVDNKKGGMEILSQSADLGEHRSFLPGKIKGESLEISFNHRFLSDGLSNIKNPEVAFSLNKEEGPAVLKPVGDQSYLYVVMPIKKS